MKENVLAYQRYLVDRINTMFSYKNVHMEMEQVGSSLTGKDVRLTAEDLYIFYQHLVQTLHIEGNLIGSEAYWSIELLSQRLAELGVEIPESQIEGGKQDV